MTEARRERMEQLLAQRRYSAALDEVAGQLTSLRVPVSRDDAVTKEAVQAAQDHVRQQERCHLVWACVSHRPHRRSRRTGRCRILVSEDGESGLRLEYNHYANADEYELRSWGRYAVVVF